HIEAGESWVSRRLNEGLKRDHARQFHLEGRTVHCAVVIGDDVHSLEENRFYCVPPGPQRQRIITQRPKISVEHQGRKTAERNMHVQATLLTSLERCRHAADGLLIGQHDRIVKPERRITRKLAICGGQSSWQGIRRPGEDLPGRYHGPFRRRYATLSVR